MSSALWMGGGQWKTLLAPFLTIFSTLSMRGFSVVFLNGSTIASQEVGLSFGPRKVPGEMFFKIELSSFW